MRTKPLAGFQVPAIGLGTGILADDEAEAVAALRLAFDAGLLLVDTAEVYGDGRAERLVARAAETGAPIRIATKISPEHLHPKDIRPALDASLRRLGRDSVDLYQIHWSNPAVPLADTLSVLEDLASEGKIGAIGVCNFSMRELRLAKAALSRVPLASLQAEYNLFDRHAERDMLPFCEDNGIAFLAYSPLDQGHICGTARGRETLAEVGRRHGCSAGAVALSWLARRDCVIPIPRAKTAGHIRQNALAGELHLDPEDLAAIDRACGAAPAEIAVDRIRVVPENAGGWKVYATLDEAKRNIYGLTPSPMELAEQILSGDFLKPIRLHPLGDGGDYELIEGRIRYWAWVIAFDGEKPVPALIRE